MDVDLYGAGHAHDRAGPGILLWRPCQAEECVGDNDAIVLRFVFAEHSMDIVGVQPIVRSRHRPLYR